MKKRLSERPGEIQLPWRSYAICLNLFFRKNPRYAIIVELSYLILEARSCSANCVTSLSRCAIRITLFNIQKRENFLLFTCLLSFSLSSVVHISQQNTEGECCIKLLLNTKRFLDEERTGQATA